MVFNDSALEYKLRDFVFLNGLGEGKNYIVLAKCNTSEHVTIVWGTVNRSVKLHSIHFIDVNLVLWIIRLGFFLDKDKPSCFKERCNIVSALSQYLLELLVHILLQFSLVDTLYTLPVMPVDLLSCCTLSPVPRNLLKD